MKRVLVFGGNGQVGQALQAVPASPDITLIPVGRDQADLTNHPATQKLLNELRPDLVINTAAMTNVDQCERERDKAVAANFEAPANLAAQCAARDLPLIHLSTRLCFRRHGRRNTVQRN